MQPTLTFGEIAILSGKINSRIHRVRRDTDRYLRVRFRWLITPGLTLLSRFLHLSALKNRLHRSYLSQALISPCYPPSRLIFHTRGISLRLSILIDSLFVEVSKFYERITK